eukprot:77292-Chlamydomonas_euryale.AAC.3
MEEDADTNASAAPPGAPAAAPPSPPMPPPPHRSVLSQLSLSLASGAEAGRWEVARARACARLGLAGAEDLQV